MERENCETLEQKVQVVINQAEPIYTVPTELKGNSGTTLGQIRLPQGFSWENASVKLKEEGKKGFYAVYTPGDTQNYKTVSHIAINVTVTCPGHNYASKVTVPPTATKKGQMTYTCSLCGNTYTEEIEILKPDSPGGQSCRKFPEIFLEGCKRGGLPADSLQRKQNRFHKVYKNKFLYLQKPESGNSLHCKSNLLCGKQGNEAVCCF